MPPPTSHGESQRPGALDAAVPAGSPAWITAELIRETIRVWQPYYSASVTPEDAVTILMRVGELLPVLAGGLSHE